MTGDPATPEVANRPGWWPEGLPGTVGPATAGERRLRVDIGDFAPAARILREAGARFVTVFATGGAAAVVAVLALRGELVVIEAQLGRDPGAYDDLGSWWPAARWAERELVQNGIVRVPGVEAGTTDASRLDRRVEGQDVFALPFGPIRSGVFEAIQFVIETGGEDVARMQTRPYLKHRGLERAFEGAPAARGVYVAERIAGISSVAYAVAYSQAVERALGVSPPPRAQRWRALYAELERVANHLDVIAKQAETTALSVGQARFQMLKEEVLRLQARLTGSRFARGAVFPGGVREDAALDPAALPAWLDGFEQRLSADRRMFLGTASMTDRLIGTGHLPRPLVEELGAVGPLARGSGLSVDARHERPYGAYRHLGLRVVSERACDAMARVRVRFREIDESLRVLRQAADQLARRDGDLVAELPDGDGTGIGWVEASQGELVLWVELEAGTVRRVHVASPSLRNYALFEHAFPSDVLTDFAFIEHSFGLTPAGAAR